MRKKQIIVLLIVLVFINVGTISFAMFGTAKESDSGGLRPLEEMAMMDLTHKNFIEREALAREGYEPLESHMAPPLADVGDPFTFTVSDDGLGIDYNEDFRIILEGTHCYILVTEDAYQSYLLDGTYYHFANPYGDDSEPWARSEDLISHDQLVYLMTEFDENIYPNDTRIFGIPNNRPSDDPEGDKIWTLIFNIRDASYYDPYDPDITSYIAGYFSFATSNENDKNIMHIDTYDWANRVGPGVERPYLYEGVFAHEFQHLIHADHDPDEPSWTDEACADMAMYLCGYGHQGGHIANYIVYHFLTSLTFWGNGLDDYGASYLWALYMYEHYGGEEFFTTLVQEQANGIEGVENTLKTLGYHKSFVSLFDDWTIANYLDDEKRYGGKYGYETLDFGTEDTWGYSIEQALTNFWWGPPDHITEDYSLEIPSDLLASFAYGVPGIEPQPYTAHYYRFTNDKFTKIHMDADDFAGTLPYSGSYEWYSDAEAWSWRSFYQTFTIPSSGATLNFKTFFEIEGDWDYGYVEVYDNYDDKWYTLDTTDFSMATIVAHGQDNPNCPDGREPTDYEDAGEWYAFTGYSGGWIDINMDLTPFAGHTIDIYFTLWQDGAFTLQNMWVDDISIQELDPPFSDDVESGEDGWTSTGWYISDGMFDNGWDVTVITVKDVPTERYPEEPSTGKLIWRHNMLVWKCTQSGLMLIGPTPPESEHVRVAIVSNHANHILTSHYDLTIEQLKWGYHSHHH